MAIQKVDSALLLGASKSKTSKGNEVFRLNFGGGKFLQINPIVYDMVAKGEIASVQYDDDVQPLIVKDAEGKDAELRFYNINGVVRSTAWKLEQAKKIAESAAGIDLKAVNDAIKMAEGLVL